ncbi:cap-specific mRNA (nucleoside-2'-O-)-methyltransferase 1-like isoform X2 [Condylostylus longicornis]|uniref:cap-specific mRNA (nucleoside-2'-O-)-methyltransferase 1-like isoform X2 n=1 Tax=Condylostylus longicornis TaxID=2530218 RepID=UPI00244DFA37|nr:cap-specific mRNA (nucleoside-2'-O-)-methyltransferase 1-like isoform X2 [Condylostylus longicornis]
MEETKKPFKIKDTTRHIKKAIMASSLEEMRNKCAEKFEKIDQLPTIHLDSDGTEIDDEEYFRTLEENSELIAVFPGEHWVDPTQYVTISSHRKSSGDTTDAAAAAENDERIRKLVGQLQNNLCNVSVMNDTTDLETLSNMDPNSLVDLIGKDFIEQLRESSGRDLCAKRTAEDRINLLKLLREGAIFCSERYPEDAEDIEFEINQQMQLNQQQYHNHNFHNQNDNHNTQHQQQNQKLQQHQQQHQQQEQHGQQGNQQNINETNKNEPILQTSNKNNQDI